MIKSFIICLYLIVLNSGILKAQLSAEWVRTYNGSGNNADEALSHAIDMQGNVYSTGRIFNTGSGMDIFTVKFSSSGSIIWERTYNGPGNANDIAHSIGVDDNGNVYVGGESIPVSKLSQPV